MLIMAGSTISNHTISPSIHHARPCFHNADANEGHAAWGRDSSWRSNNYTLSPHQGTYSIEEFGFSAKVGPEN